MTKPKSAWTHTNNTPKVGGTYLVGGYVTEGPLPRHFDITLATLILTLGGPEWTHRYADRAHIPMEYWLSTGPHPEHARANGGNNDRA